MCANKSILVLKLCLVQNNMCETLIQILNFLLQYCWIVMVVLIINFCNKYLKTVLCLLQNVEYNFFSHATQECNLCYKSVILYIYYTLCRMCKKISFKYHVINIFLSFCTNSHINAKSCYALNRKWLNDLQYDGIFLQNCNKALS